jgi:EAL domain-containing protein (putative c-di-GMP-specific phosphodiesterase class I)
VRWRHPEHGVIPPGLFVPLAESSGLVVEMTEQVFHQALEFAGRPEFSWRGRPLGISVNLATASLVERGLAELISTLLASSGIASSRLTVEITETAMSTDRTNVLEVLSRLRLRGVQLSIDDFGTGTSSLERLDQMPCTELKVERAFVADVLHRVEVETIVRSTIELARQLELHVVAEGIEDLATLTWLREANCESGQGFLFSKGLEGPDFLSWLAAWPELKAALLAAPGA